MTLTRRQSNNEWSGGIAAKIQNKKIRMRISAGKFFSSTFLGSLRHPPNWLSSKRTNYERWDLLIFAGATEGNFEGKKPREDHQVVLLLARQCPGSRGTCNPEETGLTVLPMSRSRTLFPGYGPVTLRPVTWTEKTIEKLLFVFRCEGHWCRRDMVGRTTYFYFIFWVASKVRVTG